MRNMRTAAFVILFSQACVHARLLDGVELVDVCYLPDGQGGDFFTIQMAKADVDNFLQDNPTSLQGACSDSCDTLCSDNDLCTVDYDPELGCDGNTCFVESSRYAVDCDDGITCVREKDKTDGTLFRFLTTFFVLSFKTDGRFM